MGSSGINAGTWGIHQLKPSKQQQKQNHLNMSDWVRLDITAFTKTTNREKVLKILKGAKVDCCEITDQYMNTDRNKNCISIVIKRSDFETKTPDYPGSWIIEEDYAAQPTGGDLLRTASDETFCRQNILKIPLSLYTRGFRQIPNFQP